LDKTNRNSTINFFFLKTIKESKILSLKQSQVYNRNFLKEEEKDGAQPISSSSRS